MIGRRIGRFRVVEKIGEGGMATVWKAHDELLDRTVALKTLSSALSYSDDARRRFHHEAEVGQSLDHPGIAAILATGEDHGLAYLAMAYIDGETLADRLGRRLIPIPEVIEIVTVAAAALGYAHARGVVHRDVTSRNIMLARDGRVFVLDFGLAIAAGISRITSRNTTVGTIAYMAPELLAGCEADARTDLYGLGVVLYEALTGTLPFAAKTAEVLKYAALNQEARAPRTLRPELPPELERVALKAIARDPDERYQTADELMRDLHDASATASEPPGVGTLSPGAQRLRDNDPVHLAVLPIETPEPVAEDADGMRATIREELETALRASLASVGRIHVLAATEAVPVGEDGPAVRAFARRLGANLLLRGTLRRQGSQLRFVHALLDPEANVQVAGGTLGGSVTERFDFEDRVVRNVQEALAPAQAPQSAAGVSRAPDPAAEDHYAQALAYLKRYDNEASVDGAIRTLEQLTASPGENATYHATLARAYLYKHALTQERVWESRAAAAVERAVAAAPAECETCVALGQLRIATGDHEGALSEFAAALERKPDCDEALLGSAVANVRLGRYGEAEAVCRRVIAAKPDDWRGHSHLGWVFYQHGDAAAALGPWTRVVELVPDNARGRLNLGSAYYHLNRFDEAVSSYRKSLLIQPNRLAYRNLGTALYFLGQFEEAIAVLRKATELTPSDPLCWGNLGTACINLSRHLGLPGYEEEGWQALDRAISLMREWLERNPNVGESWAFLASWLVDVGRAQDAEAAIHRALELDPDNPSCMARAGHVHFRLGDSATSLRWLGDAVHAGFPAEELARSLELAPLRQFPEFIQLLSGPGARTLPDPGGRVNNLQHDTRRKEGGRS